jgi:hypothetical protein
MMPDPRPEPDPEIADAALLFGGSGPEAPKARPSAPSPADPGGYAVEGPEAEAEAPVTPPIAPVPRAERPRPAAKPEAPVKRARRASSGVDETWSRGAEWGTDLVRVGIAMLVAGYLLYATFSIHAIAAWLVLLAFSAVGLAILAYPIFMTLERPVRVTPEQAAKDYFAALSHRVPHFKRMWLLLSTDGRRSPSFDSFPAFQGYWKAKLAQWKADARSQGVLNPLTVEVSGFKSEKSAGQTEIDGEYTASVMDPGRTEPVATYHVKARFVRGDDRMWYLESGTLD